MNREKPEAVRMLRSRRSENPLPSDSISHKHKFQNRFSAQRSNKLLQLKLGSKIVDSADLKTRLPQLCHTLDLLEIKNKYFAIRYFVISIVIQAIYIHTPAVFDAFVFDCLVVAGVLGVLLSSLTLLSWVCVLWSWSLFSSLFLTMLFWLKAPSLMLHSANIRHKTVFHIVAYGCWQFLNLLRSCPVAYCHCRRRAM